MSTSRMIFEQNNVQYKIYQRLHSYNFNNNFNKIIITVNLFCVCRKNFKTSWELLQVLFYLVLTRHYLLSTITPFPSNRVQNLLRESDLVLWYVSTCSKKNTSSRRPTYRIHCRNREPASMLLLGKIQKRNHCRLLIVGWIVR